MKNRKGDKEIKVIVLGLDLDGDKITVAIGGEARFIIPADNILDLFDKLQWRRREGPKRESEFPAGLDTRENFVFAQRLLKKGLDAERAARVMGIRGELFRRFLNHGIQEFGKDKSLNDEEMAKHAAEDLVERKPVSKGWPAAMIGATPPAEYVFLELHAVKPFLRAGKSVTDAAAALGLVEESLAKWIEANKPYLDLV